MHSITQTTINFHSCIQCTDDRILLIIVISKHYLIMKKQINYVKRMEIGVRRGVSVALDRHKKLGQSIVIWKDGKVVEVPPEEIVVPHYPDDSEIDD